jgi:hypothetical protein
MTWCFVARGAADGSAAGGSENAGEEAMAPTAHGEARRLKEKTESQYLLAHG